jgi:hypothetical protein
MVSVSSSRGRRSQSWSASTLRMCLVCTLLGLFCFYIGFLIGTTANYTKGLSEDQVQKRITEAINKESFKWKDAAAIPSAHDDTANRFPDEVHDFAIGMSRIQRDEFAKKFDMGVPLDVSSPKNDDVIVLYSSEKALPNDLYASKEAESQTTMPLMSAEDATENCDFLNVVLTDHSGGRRQCVALFGQYEGFHVQKWMRLPETGKLDATEPLRLVNRGAQASGRKSTRPPSTEDTLKYWSILTQYLSSLEGVLEKLKPIAEAVAVNNSIVVLVCNFGQSELLINFICAARSRGIDLKAVLVFATDEETRDLATSLGVSAFYDETNYGSMPKEAAGRYADNTFTSMMLAKVYCVQMISMLGYDLLFQDVDIVWHRNPLDFFHDPSNAHAGFDTYFQDDGNHGLFYAPYSANTGFYYVRNNDKTRNFFNSFLMSGDLIFSTHSHQVPLVALLSEHASMYGLTVKIFSRTENDFPGGHAFHRRKDFMKDIISGVEKPYIFHMSWTHNKDNKRKFFEQLGEWRVQDQCVQKKAQEIAGSEDISKADLAPTCCASEPIVHCHYRDKPSKIPCKDSPPIDKGKPSFW